MIDLLDILNKVPDPNSAKAKHIRDKLTELRDNDLHKFVAAYTNAVSLCDILCINIDDLFRIATQEFRSTKGQYYCLAWATKCKPIFDEWIKNGRKPLAWPAKRNSPSTLRMIASQTKNFIIDFLDTPDRFYAENFKNLIFSLSVVPGAQGIILIDRQLKEEHNLQRLLEPKDWKERLEKFIEKCTDLELVIKNLFSEADLQYIKSVETACAETDQFKFFISSDGLRVINNDYKLVIERAKIHAEQVMAETLAAKKASANKEVLTEIDDQLKTIEQEPVLVPVVEPAEEVKQEPEPPTPTDRLSKDEVKKVHQEISQVQKEVAKLLKGFNDDDEYVSRKPKKKVIEKVIPLKKQVVNFSDFELGEIPPPPPKDADEPTSMFDIE